MAELVSIKRNVDVSPGQAAPAVFHCSQGDVGSKIILGLLNNGTAYTIPSGVTATIEGSESNGSIFTPISATVSGSDITFYLTGEMTAVAGPAICQAVLKSGSNILGTANFTLEVESSPMGADAPPVFTDAGWTWMLNKLNTEFVPALGNETIIDAIDSKADQSDLTALSNTVAGHTGSITVLNNTVNTLNHGVTENRQNIARKLDKNQGTANAGKYLKVQSTGQVVPVDLIDDSLLVETMAADAKATGVAISKKLNKYFGQAEAGKYLKVGTSGYVDSADLDVTTDKTLSITDKAADAKAVGDELTDLKADLGDLSNLETEDKSNLVAAINEAAQSGGSGTGLTEDMKQALLTCFRNVAWKENDDGALIDALEESLYPPANLTRITAVYTQSGTVTNWNTLDDLRPDLLVTAYFDNGSSQIVSHYSLSGSLVAPSCVITATYGGKTSTFNVIVTNSNVPAGYTEYDYIEMVNVPTSGTAARYYTIITDAQMHSDYSFETQIGFGANIVSDLGANPVLGTRNGVSGSLEFAMYVRSKDGLVVIDLDGNEKNQGLKISITANTLSTYKYLPVGNSKTYPDNNVIEINGIQYNTELSITNTEFKPWFGFFNYATSANGHPSSTTYYRGYIIGETTIKDSNDNLVYHFVPAKNSDDIYGFYETVNKKFYYNNYNDGALLEHYTGGHLEVS